MSIVSDEQTSIADIDEALAHLQETFERTNLAFLKTIMDGLLDERLEKHNDLALLNR